VEKELGALAGAVREARHGAYVSGRVSAADAKALREAGDRLAAMLERGTGVLWTAFEDRYAAQIVVSAGLVPSGVTASRIARALGEKLGVRGGGKDTSAQVGGKLDMPLEQVIGETWTVLESVMSDGQ
jgi:alanyl-tRNA synthetase